MPKALLTTLALLLSGEALAVTKSLAVVDLQTPPNMMGLGQQVTRALQAEGERTGFQVTPPADVRQILGAGAYDDLLKCGGNVGCVLPRARRLKTQRLVWGSLDRDEKSYLLQLWLIELPSGKPVSDVRRAVLIASRRLTQVVDEVVPKLLRGERDARGILMLSSSTPGAQVHIDGSPVGHTPLTVELAPGQHEVALEKDNFLPVKRMVTVESSATTEENVRILRIPGGGDPLALPDSPVASASSRGSNGGGLGLPNTSWVAFSVAALAAGGGVALGLSAKSLETELQDGFDASANRYAGTREDALEGRRRAKYANVLYGVAGAAAVTGTLLWLLTDEEPPVALTPTSSGGQVSWQGRY